MATPEVNLSSQTIAGQIERLQNAKTSLKASIIAKGVSVPTSATLDSYYSYVDSIEQGGGGGSSDEVIEVFLHEDDVYTINCEEFQESGKEGHRVFYINELSGDGAEVVVRRNGTTLKTIAVGRTILFFWNDAEFPIWYRDSNRERF